MTQVAPPPAGEAQDWYRGLLQVFAGMIEERVKGLRGPRTVTLWFGLGSGSAAIATTDYIDVPLDFPFLVTGWTLLSRDNGAIVLSVRRAAYLDYPSFVSITGSTPPTLVNRRNKADDLVGWTQVLEADDVLAIGCTSNAGGLTRVSLGLRGIPLGDQRSSR